MNCSIGCAWMCLGVSVCLRYAAFSRNSVSNEKLGVKDSDWKSMMHELNEVRYLRPATVDVWS